jgi:hypothetical protein
MNQLYDLICLRSTKQEILMELAFAIWPLNFSRYQYTHIPSELFKTSESSP